MKTRKMNKRYFTYVAGPMSKGEMIDNISQALKAGARLREKGIIPLIPHLNAFESFLVKTHGEGFANTQSANSTADYAGWLQDDFALIERAADSVLRLPGESYGADREVEFAQSLGIPVFRTVSGVVQDYVEKNMAEVGNE